MNNLPGATTQEKTDSPSTNSHPLPEATLQGVGLCVCMCVCVDCVCECVWTVYVGVCGLCVYVWTVCVWTVGGLLNILVDVSFPPLLLRPWSDHFYACDSFMKHKTRSGTWHEIGNKAQQKEEQFSGRMCSQYG